jgi:hypothetical protein
MIDVTFFIVNRLAGENPLCLGSLIQSMPTMRRESSCFAWLRFNGHDF